MTTITNLPIELLLAIIEFAREEGYSGSAFAVVNRSLSSLLLGKVRRITIREKERSDKMILKLLGMIDDSYHQVSIINNAEAVTNLIQTFPGNTGIESLTMDAEQAELFLSLLPNLGKEERFKVKHLRIACVDNMGYFNVIPSLETLYFHYCDNINLIKLNLLFEYHYLLSFFVPHLYNESISRKRI